MNAMTRNRGDDAGTPQGVSFEVSVVGPAHARRILAEAGLDAAALATDRVVKRYAGIMKAGKWVLNGESVVVDADGAILDGAKRLAAAALGETRFPTVLVHGVDPDVANTLGRLKRRSRSDNLKVAGVRDVPLRSATATMVRNLVTGRPTFDGGGVVVDAAFVTDMFEQNAALIDSVNLVKDMTKDSGGKCLRRYRSMLAACHFLFSLVDAEHADSYVKSLARVPCGFPAPKAVRKELSGLGAITKEVPRHVPVGIIVKGWNAWMTGDDRPGVSMLYSERVPAIYGDPAMELPVPAAAAAAIDADDLRRASQRQVSAFNRNNAVVGVEVITPEFAASVLENLNGPATTGKNRSISRHRVDGYYRDMRDARWQLNGETVKFGRSGRLIDGQHRLSGCVKSGKSFPTVVVRGIEDGAFTTIDQAPARTFEHDLEARGFKNSRLLASVVTFLWRMENGSLGRSNVQPTIGESELAWEKWRPLIEEHGLRHAMREGTQDIMPNARIAFIHTALADRDPEQAEAFVASLYDGVGLERGDPVLLLRNTLMSRVKDGRHSGTRIAEDDLAKLVFTAWNMRREGGRKFPWNQARMSVPSGDVPARL